MVAKQEIVCVEGDSWGKQIICGVGTVRAPLLIYQDLADVADSEPLSKVVIQFANMP